MATLDIRLLADRPAALAVVSKWVHDEWGCKFHTSLEQIEDAFRERLYRDQIPFTLVGEVDGKPVATASVVACDLSEREDLYPWLGTVLVEPACRGLGYGSALVRAACDRVAALGCDRLYLYTAGAPGFYETLGWATLEKRVHLGDEITVMWSELHAQLPGVGRSRESADAH